MLISQAKLLANLEKRIISSISGLLSSSCADTNSAGGDGDSDGTSNCMKIVQQQSRY